MLVESERKKLQKFDSNYFRGKDRLEENYLVFKPMNKYLKKIGNIKSTSSWKSKVLSDEAIKPPTNNSLALTLEYAAKKMYLKFNGSSLIKQDEFSINRKTVNICIIYDIDSNLNNFDTTLENYLFGAIKLTKTSALANTSIEVIALDLMQEEIFHFQVVALLKMPLFLELT